MKSFVQFVVLERETDKSSSYGTVLLIAAVQ
jgi:hypothetical protein